MLDANQKFQFQFPDLMPTPPPGPRRAVEAGGWGWVWPLWKGAGPVPGAPQAANMSRTLLWCIYFKCRELSEALLRSEFYELILFPVWNINTILFYRFLFPLNFLSSVSTGFVSDNLSYSVATRVYRAGSSLLEPKCSSWAGATRLGDKVKILPWLGSGKLNLLSWARIWLGGNENIEPDQWPYYDQIGPYCPMLT